MYQRSIYRTGLAVAGLLSGISIAGAADLGSNCCADLEERIAELEATTVRKGNRKVSLTVSGWVAQQVLVWNDGIRTKAYIADLGDALASHVKFSGSAKINSDWSAGYVLHIEAISNEPLAQSAAGPADGKAVGVYQSYWFIKSSQLGQISVGLNSSATDNGALYPDPSGTIAAANYVLYDNNNFSLVRSIGGQKVRTGQNWGSLATCATVAGGSVGHPAGSGRLFPQRRSFGRLRRCSQQQRALRFSHGGRLLGELVVG